VSEDAGIEPRTVAIPALAVSLGVHTVYSITKAVSQAKVFATEYTEWKPPLSGVHSITMEKLAQAGEGGGSTPTPFHYCIISTIMYNVVLCSS
jgi:hypothetical protein